MDYLLKPIRRARLEQALARMESAAVEDAAIDKAGPAAGSYPHRFLAKRSARFCVVPGSEVLYFASDGGQTKLQAEHHHYWMQPTLSELSQRLDPAKFFRSSRSTIVNLDAVREVLPLTGGQAEIKLRDGTTLDVSRRRYRELIDRLGL